MTRKIEDEMLRALMTGRPWSKDNTYVTVRYKIFNDQYRAVVYLHKNLIAQVYFDTSSTIYPTMLDITMSGYPIRTTVSRLNALMGRFTPGKHPAARICTRKGVQYLQYDGKDAEMDAKEWYSIPCW